MRDVASSCNDQSLKRSALQTCEWFERDVEIEATVLLCGIVTQASPSVSASSSPVLSEPLTTSQLQLHLLENAHTSVVQISESSYVIIAQTVYQ